jgi:uncharacterized membrane protein
MVLTLLFLRLIHVVCGVFWAGTTFVLATHISPTIKAIAPDGQKFMTYLTGKAKISDWLGITASLTFLSGGIMYFINFQTMYLPSTGQGIALLMGVILGSVAWGHGATAQRGAIGKMQKLGMEIAKTGGPPTPEQAAEMGKLSAKIEQNGQLLAIMLGITVVLMGTFQYINF